LTNSDQVAIIWWEWGDMRQLIYGLILGAAAMYCYARLDPPKVLAYLNSATKSAVDSTHAYGGRTK